MTAEMCRVSIRSAHHDTDLALPADLPICELIPSVVDLLGDDVCGRDVRLLRSGGDVLDAARTLAQCGVYDGESLILTAATESTHQPRFDLCDSVVHAVGQTDPGIPAQRPKVAMVAVLCSAAAVAVLLGSNAFAASTAIVGAGCGTTISALVGAVALRRDPTLAVTLAVVAAALAGLSAQVAVLALPGFLLAMSAVSAISLIGWRLLDHGTAMLLPLAGMTMPAAAAALAGALGWLAPVAVGPVLATASLVVLAAAPRLAARLSGLSVSARPDDIERRAANARQILNLLVTATAGASAVGTLVTAVLAVRPLEAVSFITGVAAILLLRCRIHPDPQRVAALAISAGLVVMVVIGLLAVHAPWATTWLCGLLIAGAATAIALDKADLSLSPTADRVISALEYTVGAAVIPLGCVAAGFFTAIRSLV